MSTPEDPSLDVGARARASLEGADWDQLARVFAGEATSSEHAAVAAWVAADPSRGAAVEALRQAWLNAGTCDSRWARWSPEAGWYALAPRLAADAPPSSRVHRTAIPHPWPRGVGRGVRSSERWAAVRIAAVVILLAGGSMAIWRVAHRSGTQQFREFASSVGSRATVTLRDGTHLILGPATRLRVPRDFGASTRTVELTGEALFAVVHDVARPFAVRTARAMVRDVGTTFVVRAYPDDAVDRVAVEDGQVALGSCRRGSPPAASVAIADACAMSVAATPLTAGDLATVGDTTVSVRHSARLASLTAWVQGGLSFEDTPFRDVVHDIDRAFGVHIIVADSTLLAKPVTGTFPNQPLDIVLDAVTRVVGARYERSGRGIVIRSGLTGAREPGDAPRTPLTTARAMNAHE